MKILILKPSSLGDVIHAVPVLRLLKQHLPKSEIYWWLSSDLLPLLQGDPDLAGIIPFERKKLGKPSYWPKLIRDTLRVRKQRFDWVIDLQSLARSGLFSWFAHGDLTIGLDDLREGASGFYDIFVPRPSYHTHAVDWYLETLKVLKVPVHWNFEWLPIRPQAKADVERKWETWRHRWIIINPGARWTTKRWPVEYFQSLTSLLASHYPNHWFAVTGGKEDRPAAEAIRQTAPEKTINLAGQTSLPEMIEWVRLCDLMITNDTGPMHVAAALRKPMAGIFGPTEPRRTGPYWQLNHVLQQRKLPCVPCLKARCKYRQPLECLHSIRPETVFDLVRHQLHQNI